MTSIRQTSSKAAFFGSPEFVVPILHTLIETGWQVPLVVTQPDRPQGRGRATTPSAVAEYARSAGLEVLTPERAVNALPALTDAAPEVLVVAAYGEILPAEILACTPHGAVNVHFSLLPAYRGASPVAQALLDGVPETGVTIMKMDDGLDTGPILASTKVPINPDDTAGSLTSRLAVAAAPLLASTLREYVIGAVQPQPQSPDGASLTRKLTKDDGRITWQHTDVEIEQFTRAMSPWPGAWTTWEGQTVKILEVQPSSEATLEPGAIEAGSTLHVGTGGLPVEIRRLQFPGGRPMTGAAAVAGYSTRLRRFV